MRKIMYKDKEYCGNSMILAPRIRVQTFSWSSRSLPSGEYVAMATFQIPAGARVLILGRTGNGIRDALRNACLFSRSSGTVKVNLDGGDISDSGAGNRAVGWYYIEAETDCTVLLRQYGYGSDDITTATGVAAAISLDGDEVTIS